MLPVNSGFESSFRLYSIVCPCSPLSPVLPERITAVLENAIPELGKKLKGFDAPDAVMTAPETRSSSPVRILRDAAFMSPLTGLIPCGEGAGYAGGISSAACDGMRCAEAYIRRYGTIEGEQHGNSL